MPPPNFSRRLLAFLLFGLCLVPPMAAFGAEHLTSPKIKERTEIVKELKTSGHSQILVRVTRNRLFGHPNAAVGRILSREKSLTVVERFDRIGMFLLDATAEEIDRVARDPDVVSIYHSGARYSFPNDGELRSVLSPTAVDNVATRNKWFSLIGVTEARAIAGIGGGRGIVFVLDTGVDPLPFFNGKVLDGACFSTSNESHDGLCEGRLIGRSCDLLPECNHGRHVASVVHSIAPGAIIIPVMVMSEKKSTGDLDIQDPDLASALEYIATLMRGRYAGRMAVINMSFGNGAFPKRCGGAFQQVFEEFRHAGVLSVASSGNEGKHRLMNEPACYPDVFDVGASTYQDDRAADSNFATSWAPGKSIPVLGGSLVSGTSYAAPQVTAALAIFENCCAASLARLDPPTLFPVDIDSNTLNGPRLNIASGAAFLGHGKYIVTSEALDERNIHILCERTWKDRDDGSTVSEDDCSRFFVSMRIFVFAWEPAVRFSVFTPKAGPLSKGVPLKTKVYTAPNCRTGCRSIVDLAWDNAKIAGVPYGAYRATFYLKNTTFPTQTPIPWFAKIRVTCIDGSRLRNPCPAS